MPGRPGARGPGRVPVGSGPRRCSNGRAGSAPTPPVRDVWGLPAALGCCGRMGCPGLGPGLDSRDTSGSGPRFPVGRGPRFPVANGRAELVDRVGALGRAATAPGAAAAGRTAEACVPTGAVGRAAGAPAGPAGPAGRTGFGVGVGVAGFAAVGAPADAGTGALGTILGAAGAPVGAAPGGVAVTAGLVTVAAGAAGAGGFTTAGPTAVCGGAVGLILAAFAVASLASFSALAAASA